MAPLRERLLEKEGTQFPSKTYTEMVLKPAFDEAKGNFVESMIQIHFAHLIMLVDVGLVSKTDARKIIAAIHHLKVQDIKESEYEAKFEDLFFKIEQLLIEDAGDIAGNLHIARSRNDMGIALYRMTLRKKILGLMESSLLLREALIEMTREHIDTVMIGYTHTQQAQPTTLAHYFNAMTDMLTRDMERLKAAYKTVNRSSMGSAALTTSGFAVNRQRVQELLGFEELIDNAWDAVSGADYIAETATAVQLSAINLGRSIQDFLLWGTQEFGAFLLATPYVQISSIMPQKRNPVSIEHMRALLSSVTGDAQTILLMLHNTPFGDIVDTEDDMQPYMWRALEKLGGIYRLLASVLITMEVDKQKLLERAQKSFANVTELADTIVRTDRLSFRQAHHIVSATVRELMEHKETELTALTLSILNKHAEKIVGHSLSLTEEQLKETLDPAHFVKIRSLEGGPSPDRMKQTIEKRLKDQKHLEAWLQEKRALLEKANQEVNTILKKWMEEDE
ncbi:argininosuccinate lyase [Bacillus oleivorans]|uniref:Argininosuccinate lyase n=1 Tax=Bacillus oleivorans TaxID=1448271 RepID=A0A285CIB2_9BACI|nr:argininosuccinate lyase [Bacillus oleivorans]SNX67249.1 argininosuccinate lyase [Bacillus oleivorans]